MPTRDEAWQLVCDWTESDSLRKHVLGVEAAMRAAKQWLFIPTELNERPVRAIGVLTFNFKLN